MDVIRNEHVSGTENFRCVGDEAREATLGLLNCRGVVIFTLETPGGNN